MPLERAREWAGQQLRPKQYVDEDDAETPAEIQDPHTWRDEASPSFRDKLAAKKYQTLSKSFVLLTLTGILIGGLRRFFPEIYHSEMARTAAAVVAIVVGTALLTIKWMLNRLENFDWLVLNLPSGIEVYLGEFDSTTEGNPQFLPIRGFTLWGSKANNYELGELSDDFARAFSKQDRSADDPLRMGLPPEIGDKARKTWFGTVISVVSDGVEPDGASREIDVRVWPSSRDHSDTIQGLMGLVRQKDTRIEDLQDDLADMRESRNKYRREAKKTRSEVRQEFISDQTDMFEAINPSVNMSAGQHRDDGVQQSSPSATGGTGQTDPVVQDAMEVMNDD